MYCYEHRISVKKCRKRNTQEIKENYKDKTYAPEIQNQL